MAHFAVVVEDDSQRRERFLAGARRLFESLPGLTIGERRDGPWACIWATGPRAPIDVHEDAEGCAIFIGYGVAADDRRVAARDLRGDWLAPAGRPQLHDGYHIGVAWAPRAGLVAGVDAMGMFPWQWTELGNAGPLVAATTPEVFRCHPLFEARIDRPGLAGILLVHGPLLDRPLLADTRRLPKGHLLRWSRERGAGAEPVYRLARPSPPAGESLPDLRRRIEHEHLAAIRRHAPPTDDAAILLSGGLDSRLVAASLGRLGIPTRAIALGRADDFEVRAAAAVAGRLDIPLEVVSTEWSDAEFTARARRAARFGHLSAAPGADDFAEGVAAATSTGRYLWSGIAYDWVYEPVSNAEGYDVAAGAWSFAGLVAYMNRWGVESRLLPCLLGSDGARLHAEALDDLRDACLLGPEEPQFEASRVRWDQRVRNHLATAVHRLSFHTWPLLPATDRRFMEALFGLPPTAYADRVLEHDVLRAIRPDLATVPLDTNSFRFEPPTGGRAGLGRLTASLRTRGRRFYWKVIRGHDPRRYERLFNVDHPRWRAVRRAVEPLRPLLHRHLDPRALTAVLPGPEVRTAFKNPVNAGGAVRMLLGFALLLDAWEQPGA
jgi:hypothetical protein